MASSKALNAPIGPVGWAIDARRLLDDSLSCRWTGRLGGRGRVWLSLRPAEAHEIELARYTYAGRDCGEAGREHERGDGATIAHADAEDQGNHRRADGLPEQPRAALDRAGTTAAFARRGHDDRAGIGLLEQPHPTAAHRNPPQYVDDIRMCRGHG